MTQTIAEQMREWHRDNIAYINLARRTDTVYAELRHALEHRDNAMRWARRWRITPSGVRANVRLARSRNHDALRLRRCWRELKDECEQYERENGFIGDTMPAWIGREYVNCPDCGTPIGGVHSDRCTQKEVTT